MSLNIGRNFQQFKNNNTNDIIPFLLERKYCYNTDESRNGESKSNYRYLDNEIKPQIEDEYGGNFIEPNNSLKTLVNKFTDYIINKLQPLQRESELLDTSISNSGNLNELMDEKNKTIKDLNTELNVLNNDNYKYEKEFQSSDFSFNYYDFVTNLVINSILFISTIFCIHFISKNQYDGIITPTIGVALNIIIVTIFVLYLVFNINVAALRNKSNWNQIYFKSMSNTADSV